MQALQVWQAQLTSLEISRAEVGRCGSVKDLEKTQHPRNACTRVKLGWAQLKLPNI